MPAVFINCAVILLCSALGLLLKRRLPKRLLDALMEAMGLCVVVIGIAGAVATENMLCVLVCLVVGTAIGVRGAIIPLVFGTIPFLGRQVEGALAEVPAGLIEAAQAMGSSPWEIIRRVYLKEAVPGITRGVTITLVSLINFTAIAGTLGAGGLGNFAIMYGHSKNLPQITWTVILIIVILVSIVQAAGSYIAKKAAH